MAGPAEVLSVVARSRTLLLVAASFLLFVLTEYAVWIAILVYAYAVGGATAAALVVLAQAAPSCVLAPFIATIADRHSPATLLIAGYAVQSLGMGLTAVALLVGLSPYAVYAGAVLASIAVMATRPAQAVLMPSLVRNTEELTAMNVVSGWIESVAIVAAGAMAGVLLAVGGPGLVVAACCGVGVIATLLVAWVRTPPLAVDDALDAPATVLGDVVEGLRLLVRERRPRVLVLVLTLSWVVLGALDVLFVILAISVLHKGQAWTGYLNMAFGVGSVLAGSVTLMLIGRRLAMPILVAGLAVGAGIGLAALSASALLTAFLLAVAGAGSAVLQMATRALLQRAVPAQLLGRIFGVVEGVTMAALAIGSLLTSLFDALGGPTAALLGGALLLPAGLAVCGRALLTIDATSTVPIVEIALLRSLPHFAALPAPALEGVARSLECIQLPATTVLIREGETGDRFYAIADGVMDVTVAGVHVSTQRRGDGVGEIALLRKVPRTATVTSVTEVTLYALDGETFLTAVTGHARTHAASMAIAARRLEGEAHHPSPGNA
jgi:MFS family permease